MSAFHFETCVAADWVDYNGHMRDGYYVLVFSRAIDALMDEIGLDESYRSQTGGTLYSLETHQFYLKEVHQGISVRVDSRFLNTDRKRLHIWQAMYHADSKLLLAVQETLQLHVSQVSGSTAASEFPEQIQQKINVLHTSHKRLETPEYRAGTIGIRARRTT